MITMKILCVEDDPKVLETLEAFVRRQGHEPVGAVNYDAAVLSFDLFEREFDGVLLDIALRGGKSGIDVAHYIRGMGSDVPIVAVSAHLDDDSMEKCRKAGVTAFIRKPYKIEQMQSTFENLFEPYARKKALG